MNIFGLQTLASVQDLPLIFSTISGREIADILIVSIAIYIILLFVKQTKSYFVLGVSLFLLILNFFSQNLNLTLTRSILQPLSTFTLIIIAVVFQREIRRFFKWVMTGRRHLFSRTHLISRNASAEIAESILYMAEKRIGAIFVFPGKQEIDDIVEGGQNLNGVITKELILSIFDTSSPGHDGAVIVDQDQIKMFGVHLPLARTYNFRKAGTRHRAATGITEDTDAISITVSEERGTISLAKNGMLDRIKDEASLRKILKDLTGESDKDPKGFWHYFILDNAYTKLIALTISCTLWAILVMQTGVVKKEFTIPLSFQLLPAIYQIDSGTAKTQITVVLQGRSRDITAFDGTKLEAKVDSKSFTEGKKSIQINKNMIVVPSYLTVVDVEPTKVDITISPKTPTEIKQEDEIL